MSETAELPLLIRFADVCRLFDMSVDAGYAAEREGRFPVEILRIGGIRKCRRADVERVLYGDDDA